MSFAAEDKAIVGRFQTAWAAHQATYPAKYDGSPFTQPSGAWVALTLLSGNGERIELGAGGQARFAGVIVVQIFVPESGGVRLAKTIGDLVKAVFKEVQFSTESGGLITTYQTSLRRTGQEGSFIQFNAVTPYKREEAA